MADDTARCDDLTLIGLIFGVGSAPAHASPTCDVVGSVVGAGPVGGFLCDKVGDAAAGTAADWVTSTLGKFVQSYARRHG